MKRQLQQSAGRAPRRLLRTAVLIISHLVCRTLVAGPLEEDSLPLDYQRRHALIVGISSYSDPRFSHLKGSVSDASSIAEVLARRFGFDVTLLLDDQPGNPPLGGIRGPRKSEPITAEALEGRAFQAEGAGGA